MKHTNCFKLTTFILAIAIGLCLSACSSTGKVGEAGSQDSPFVQQFLDNGAVIQINEGVIALRSDFNLPEGFSLVLNTNETWMINLNGHSIRQNHSNGKPAIDVTKGTLAIVNGNQNKNLGGVTNSDGPAIHVGAKGALQINAGVINGNEYAIIVDSDAHLIVSGGRVQAKGLPMHVQKGWSGKLTGGLFSAYDPAYDQAILGNSYASSRLGSENMDFQVAYKDSFTISQKSDYTGMTGLKLSTTSGFVTVFRLFRTFETDEISREEEAIKPAHEWLMYPGQTQEVFFESGSYVLKVAEGYHWSLTDAFGEEGTYWQMEPNTFEDGLIYTIHTEGSDKTHTPDTIEGFQSGIYVR